MEGLLILDVGTTSVKISLYDTSLNCIDFQIREYLLITKSDGVVEYPAKKYWDAISRGTKYLTGMHPDINIKGISVTTQGETLIPVDSQGAPLYNAVVWIDNRANAQADKINKRIAKDEFYTTTGVPECNGLCPVSKILWFKEIEPDIYENAKYFLLLEDYIIYCLTGVFCSEKSLLSSTGYFDINKDEIWDKVLEMTGIDKNKIPKAMECGEIVGSVKEDAALELGINSSAVVITSVMDQVASAIGAGNTRHGIVTETTGTALCIGVTTKESKIKANSNIAIYRHFCKGSYFVLCVCMTAGLVLKWFKDNFCELEMQNSKRENKDVYDILSSLAEKSPPLSKDLVVLPYFNGSLQPIYNPEARASFLNVGLEHSKSDFIRAIMEGVSYMLRENIEMLSEDLGIVIDEIRSIGGGSKSRIWNQIKADINNVKIRAMKNSECTSLGAAILCAVALKIFPSAQEAIMHCNQYSAVYEPDEMLVREYQKGYDCYSNYIKLLIKS